MLRFTETMQLVTVVATRCEPYFVENLLHVISRQSRSKSTPGMMVSLFKARLTLLEQRRGTDTSELSRCGLFFAPAVDKSNSLNDIRNQL